MKTESVRNAEVSIVLTDDESIRGLNRDYRRLDCSTDVLSFPQRSDSPLVQSPIPGAAEPLGDVVVSVETAERQAAQHRHSLEEELSLLVIHGILHLLGYDDEAETSASLMREKEQQALEVIGVESAGLVERALR